MINDRGRQSERSVVYARWVLKEGQQLLKIGFSSKANPKQFQFWCKPGDSALEAYIQARLIFDGYPVVSPNSLRVCEWFTICPAPTQPENYSSRLNVAFQDAIISDLEKYYAESCRLRNKGSRKITNYKTKFMPGYQSAGISAQRIVERLFE